MVVKKKTSKKNVAKKVVSGVKSGVKKVASVGVKTVTATTMKVKKKINIPNILTIGRIWAIPAIVLTLYFKDSALMGWISVGLFTLAGLTDYLDGYLARRLKQGSSFGRVLDPIADKLLVGAVIVMLAYTGRLDLYYCFIPAIVIMCREILVSGLREYLAEIQVGCPVTRLAKWKTTFQMLALPVLMIAGYPEMRELVFFEGMGIDILSMTGAFCLWFSAVLTVITGYDYWKSGSKYMQN